MKLNDLSIDSSPKMIRHLICVDFPTKIKNLKILKAIPHQI